MAHLIDSYSESNYDGGTVLQNASSGFMIGQYLDISENFILDSVMFYIRRTGTISGEVHAVVYTASETSTAPTSITTQLIATSEQKDVTTIGTSIALQEFVFRGDQQIFIASGSHIIIGVATDSFIEYGKMLTVGEDASSATHPGIYVNTSSSQWRTINMNWDAIFYLYGITTSPLPTYFRP